MRGEGVGVTIMGVHDWLEWCVGVCVTPYPQSFLLGQYGWNGGPLPTWDPLWCVPPAQLRALAVHWVPLCVVVDLVQW